MKYGNAETQLLLQGFEELVRMGVWDFAFIISASDLPVRSVDDFAAMLAPYRGRSMSIYLCQLIYIQ